ncbi:MAG: hypothetical protein GF350_15580 [Chitinivibrionales bacterium]|nr:hypothetical protein [Chitinivibrionales bacterium]
MSTSKKYTSPNSMRTALEERLKSESRSSGRDLMRLRRHVAFDRFLARIFSDDTPGLVAKGGYSLELRIHTARTTKDVDFSFRGNLNGYWTGNPEDLQLFLTEKANVDLQDFFIFSVGRASLDLENAPYGGFRFPIEATMAGRRFDFFSIDIAAGDAWFEPHEKLETHNWLGFAGIPPATVPVISLEQQFAHSRETEKIHGSKTWWIWC